MCMIYAQQDPAIYKGVTRSVRLKGFSTSIRLEAMYWTVLDEIAAGQGMSTPRFISELYDEVIELRGEMGNFASLLRVTCTVYIQERQKIAAAGPVVPANSLSPKAAARAA
jgi:predicted DNA-binding ribbon-helix-helix protein